MRVSLAGLAVLLLSLPAEAAAPQPPRTHVVVINQMKFGTVPAVRVGDRIQWVNRDLFRHTATAKGAGFDVDLPAGATKTATITRAGTFTVTCRYHPGMRAAMKVQAK
jgi:plastocyanin